MTRLAKRLVSNWNDGIENEKANGYKMGLLKALKSMTKKGNQGVARIRL